jgi:predicted transposase/invertase (TIGR01784 family)
MRRDSIFYRLFQQSPTLLFQLLETAPADADRYRFDAVAVKEPRFEIDGVFLPPDGGTPGIIFFCEVQLQLDNYLYERLFGESFLYFYRNRPRFSDWRAVVIYPSRRMEQQDILPYEDLINGRRLHRIYLDELGDIGDLPLEVALMQLTMLPEAEAPEAARYLLARTQEEVSEPQTNRAIIEMIKTIMVYKFTTLSRSEVEAMLDITIQETRVYQEAKAEGREEGREEGRQETLFNMVVRQLSRKLGALSDDVRSPLQLLSIDQLESLAEALLDFSSVEDLSAWLADQL